jgi:TATA-box binding protein (TBP) (component of TFIID and TFIIIB)
MTDWQTTAKTIYCDAVDDEVTILIFKNFSVHCTGCKKYTELNDITQNIIKEKNHKLKRTIKCEGEQCPRVTGYKENILAEEAK